MDRSIIDSIRAEEADLLRKLKAVRDMLTAYGEPPAVTTAQVAQREHTPSANGSREKVAITGFTDATRKSVVLAMMAMVTNQGLVKTRDLVRFIESMGHNISGNNKVNALGALLARSADIESHGKSGWTVVDRDRALAIVSEHGPKENAPQEGEINLTALGADASQGSGANATGARINPFTIHRG